MKKYVYDSKEMKKAIKNSKSLAEVLIHLNIPLKGGNYGTLKKKIKEYSLDTSHFTGQGWSKGKKFAGKYPIQDYLSNKRFINSNKLKERLIKEGYFEHRCYKCTNTEWLGEKIPIELHHIDGNHSNNNLENLTIVCCNCHGLLHRAK